MPFDTYTTNTTTCRQPLNPVRTSNEWCATLFYASKTIVLRPQCARGGVPATIGRRNLRYMHTVSTPRPKVGLYWQVQRFMSTVSIATRTYTYLMSCCHDSMGGVPSWDFRGETVTIKSHEYSHGNYVTGGMIQSDVRVAMVECEKPSAPGCNTILPVLMGAHAAPRTVDG